MDRIVIKNIILVSLVLGIILGVLSAIPYIGIISLFSLALLAAPLVIIYLIMDSKLDLTTVKDSIIYGAICGFFTNITFCACFIIVSTLIFVGFNYSVNFIMSAIIKNSPIWLMATFIIFMGVLMAVTNAFSGILTHYTINTIRDIYESKQINQSLEDSKEYKNKGV